MEDADLDDIRRCQGAGQAQPDSGAQTDERLLDEAVFSHRFYSCMIDPSVTMEHSAAGAYAHILCTGAKHRNP